MEKIENVDVIPDFDLPNLEDFEKPIIDEDEEDGGEFKVIEDSEDKGEENKKEEPESDPAAIAYFEQLKQRGYVDEEKEFKGTWEELDDYFDNLPQEVLNSVVESLPDLSKDVMRFIAASGDNITKEEMKNFFTSYFEDLENKDLSIETADDARQYLEEHYKSLGLRPKVISNTLDDLEEEEQLLEEAKKIFDEKSKVSKTSKLIEDKQKENQDIQARNQQRVIQIQEELKNIGWKPNVVTEVTKVLSGNNLNTKLKDIITNPKGLIQLANLTRLYNDKTGEFDLESFVKQVETKKTNSLKERLLTDSFSSAGVASKHRDVNPNKKDTMEGLELVL